MKPKNSRIFHFATTATLVALFSMTVQLRAQSTWTGATNGEWGTAGNWSGGVPNATGAVANINTALSVNVSDTGTGGTYPYTFGTLSANIAASTSVVIGTTAVTTDILKAATASGAPVINVTTASSNIFFYASLEGTQGFQKTGAGVLSFRFNNVVQTYTGLVDIQGGGIDLQRNESLGDVANDVKIGNGYLANGTNSSSFANLVLTSGRTIQLTDANSRIVADGTATTARNLEIQGQVTGTGSLNKEGANTLTLSGTGNNFLNTEVRVGTLTVATGSSLGTGTLAVRRGTLNLNNAAQTATGLTMGNAASAGLSQALNLGTGHTLSLTGNITYNATNNGISTIAGPGRLAASGAVRQIDVGNGTNATDLTISAVITGSQNFEKRGLGTLLMSGGTNTFTGALVHGLGITNYTTSTFTTGGFGMTGASANTSPIVNVSTTFNVNMVGFSDVIIGDQTGTGTSTLNVESGGNMLITGAASNQRPFAVANGSGSSDATGIINLNGGGNLTIAANQVDVGIGGNKLRAVRTSTGTVNINSGSTFAVLGASSATNSIYLGTTRLESGGAAPNSATVQTGTINVNIGGTLETSRTITRGAESGNTTVGNLNLDGGTLRAGTADNAAWVSGLTQFELGSGGGTIDTNGRAMGIGMAISGAGGLTKSGAGTLTLSATSGYTGATTVSSGALVINGNISTSSGVTVDAGSLGGVGTVGDITLNGGSITPGNSIGTIAAADMTWNSLGIMAFELSNANNTSDLLDLSGDFLKGSGATFAFNFLGTGLDGQTYTLVDFASTTFVQSNFSYSNLTSGLSGSFGLTGSNLTFTVVPEPNAAMLVGGLGMLALLRRRRQ